MDKIFGHDLRPKNQRRPRPEELCHKHGHKWDREADTFICVRCGYEEPMSEERSSLIALVIEIPVWE